jgi:hypothetical protein
MFRHIQGIPTLANWKAWLKDRGWKQDKRSLVYALDDRGLLNHKTRFHRQSIEALNRLTIAKIIAMATKKAEGRE